MSKKMIIDITCVEFTHNLNDNTEYVTRAQRVAGNLLILRLLLMLLK